MRALVTGGAGFIGRHLVDTLLAQGWQVRVLDPAAASLPAAVERLPGSVLDRKALAQALQDVAVAFHLAAIPHLWIPDKREYERVNVEGTRLLLEAARSAGVRRVVHTSTEAVLAGTADAAGRVDGTGVPRLADQPGPYSRSKLLAEKLALAADGQGLEVVVASPTAPLGPGDVNLTPPGRMLRDFLDGRLPAYLDCSLNLLDVRDVALGHLLAAERGRPGQRYLLAGENIRLSALLARLAAMTGLSMPRRRIPYWLAWLATASGEWLADHVTHRTPAASLNGLRLARRPLRFDPHLAESELGWRHRPLEETLADAIADLLARGLLVRRPRASVADAVPGSAPTSEPM